MQADHKGLIIKRILDMSGQYSPYNIFSDWVELCALSISNSLSMIHDKVWQEREQTYISTAQRYTEKELESFAQMFVWLGDALTDNMTDVLGQVYMEAGLGNKYTGQFFTPFNLSELCARLAIPDSSFVNSEEMIKINEPSCGGGGMIVAACKVLYDHGVNYQRRLDVVAQDLDWKGVYMTYLQLSLIGCRAIVVQGDTLTNPFDPSKTERSRMLFTPAKLGALL